MGASQRRPVKTTFRPQSATISEGSRLKQNCEYVQLLSYNQSTLSMQVQQLHDRLLQGSKLFFQQRISGRASPPDMKLVSQVGCPGDRNEENIGREVMDTAGCSTSSIEHPTVREARGTSNVWEGQAI